MERRFPLAGLLRIRRLQQETAAGALAAANRRLSEADTARSGAYTALHDLAETPVDRGTLTAIAAARASARSMLSELAALEEARRRDADAARGRFQLARERTAVLEKLEIRHDRETVAAAVRAEQLVLDELAGSRRQRTGA